MMPARSSGPAWQRGLWLPILLLIVTLLARAQTFGNPVIEFDEQFYRVMGERMLHGAVPYIDIWDRKPLGLFLIYALAAMIGGAHALAYQLVAVLFVTLTALTIHAMARRLCTGWRGPLVAAILYILWLNLLQGEGGQSSVFYALPVCAAALLVLRQAAGERPAGTLLRDGALAMLLIGLAAQIKYTVVLEGGYFGLILLFAGWQRRMGLAKLAGFALIWIALVILPTLFAWAPYAMIGYSKEWVFANFTSILLRDPMPLDDMLSDLAGGIATIVLLLVAAILGWRRAAPRGGAAWFALGWAVIGLLALFALRSFVPHYWIPIVPALALLAAPALDRMPRFAISLTIIAALVGQFLVGFFIYSKGDNRTVARMSAAIGPTPNCLFVFDGFPALYQEIDTCLPGRFLFPGHLNGIMEARSLGIDPVVEVERIMAARPDAVVLDKPRWNLQNKQTAAVVDRELAAHYTLALTEPTGKGRWRLVYRVKPQDARH
jgi:4-amino-4-deoxy-L-arabinose transferase-like glycosyltransferase